VNESQAKAFEDLTAEDCLTLALRKGIDPERLIVCGMNSETLEKFFIRTKQRNDTGPIHRQGESVYQHYLVEYPSDQGVKFDCLLFSYGNKTFHWGDKIVPIWNWWIKIQ